MRLLASLALLVLTLLPLAPDARAQTAVGPVAVVNDRVVTNYDVDQRARLLLFNGAPRNDELGRVAFDQLVEDKLKLDAAEAAGVSPEEVNVEDILSLFAEQRGLAREALPGALSQTGATMQALEDALVADALWREAVRRRFGGRAQVSEAEIDREIALGGSGAVSYRLAEIAIPTAAGDAEARAAAERARAELASGADFATVARRYSRSPSAAQGGEIGWIPRAALPVEAQTALAGTPVGGVTEPLAANGAITLLKLLERREEAGLAARAADDPEARERLRRDLFEQRLQRYAAGYLQELRGDAVIERR